jgi:MFS family permease
MNRLPAVSPSKDHDEPPPPPRLDRARGHHICLLASSGLRSTFAVYIKPIEAETGWSRSALSIAAAISLLLLGASGPLAGRLADRWGPRRVIVASLALLGVGGIAMAFVHSLPELYLTAGIITAIGSGGRRAQHRLGRGGALVPDPPWDGDRRRRRRACRPDSSS